MDEHTETQVSNGSNKMMMVLIGVVILVLLGGGAYYFMNQKTSMVTNTTPSPKAMEPTNTMKMETTTAPSPASSAAKPSGMAPSGAMAPSGKVVEVAVTGQPYSFTPNVIRVKKGDTVKVTFTNAKGFHDFVIDGYNVRTKRINSGETDTVQFVADKAGTFEFYCSVSNHRAMGMKGNLIVE